MKQDIKDKLIVTQSSSPKETSYAYGKSYQVEQVDKHRARRENHWRLRIELLHELVDDYFRETGKNPDPQSISTIDVGCSVGTIAIEMAQRGYQSHGVDFDPEALKLAESLANEEGVEITCFECDVANLSQHSNTKYDIALCFDIFEHLHDDELGSLLQSLKSCLKPDGVLIFYSFPLQYDYLFYGRWFFHIPLALFAWLPTGAFERLVKAYAAFIDIGLILFTGSYHKERIERYSHCNPLTLRRLRQLLQRAGYAPAQMRTENIYPFKPGIQSLYGKQPVAHRSVFGIASPVRK